MKKFIICLLLICVICLGCFALTACGDTNEKESSIELVNNVSVGFSNQYIFKVFYPQKWFDLGWAPSINISCKFDTSDNEFFFSERQYYAQWIQINPEAQFDDTYSIVPNTWVYFRLNTDVAPNYLRVIICSAIQDEPILLDYQLNIQGTFKYKTA